jgi:hypothetical protein
MPLVTLIFRRIVSEFMGKCFVRRCVDNVARVGKMVTPSIPIAKSPAFIMGLGRCRVDGNIGPLKGRRWSKGNFNEGG